MSSINYRFDYQTKRRIDKYKRSIRKTCVFIAVEIIVLFAIIGSGYHAHNTTEIEPTKTEVTYSEPTPTPSVVHIVPSNYIYLTDEEKHEMATLVFLESGAESFECMCGVASVIVNRMTIEDKSLEEVIYASGQFDPAYLIPYYEPSESAIEAVEYVISHGPTIPPYVTFFRADYYHDWGDRYIPYTSIDSTYFSYDSLIRELWEDGYAF